MPRSFSSDLAQALALMLLELDADLKEFAYQLECGLTDSCAAVPSAEAELFPPR